MGSWLYHYLYQDFYSPVWPNLVASLVVYVSVMVKLRALRKLHEELRDLHERHREELAKAHKGLSAVIAEARDAKTAAESAHAAIKTLAAARGLPAPPWRKT